MHNSKAQNNQLADGMIGGKNRQVIEFSPQYQVLDTKVPGLFVLLPTLVSLTNKQTFQSVSKKCLDPTHQTNSALLKEAQIMLIISSHFCFYF